jgi:hypothetical protein
MVYYGGYSFRWLIVAWYLVSLAHFVGNPKEGYCLSPFLTSFILNFVEEYKT